MRRQRPSTVRSSAFLRSVLSFAKTCSIGLRSGEYGGKKHEMGASRANDAADRAAFVRAEVIHDNDVAGAQRRSEHVFDISLETFAVDGTVEDARRIDASTAQSGHEGQGFPMAVGNLGMEPLAAPAPSRSGDILVFVQVSSKKTRRSGASRA